MKAFTFNPDNYTDRYQQQGYIHVADGVNLDFISALKEDLQRLIEKREKLVKDWQIKNEKQQLLFDFFDDASLYQEVCDKVAIVAGWKPGTVKVAERHFKVYEPTADPNPPAHKDRLASEITVGIPMSIPHESAIYLYPELYRDTNPFVSWAEMRNYLDEDMLPEHCLRDAKPVTLSAKPGDIVMFAGSSMYHKRINGAGATLLYLKLNSLGLDPIAEDLTTLPRRRHSLELLNRSDADTLLECVVDISPRLHRINRQYTRDAWKEVITASIFGEKDFALSEAEFLLLKALDKPRTVKSLLEQNSFSTDDVSNSIDSVKRLVKHSAVDILK